MQKLEIYCTTIKYYKILEKLPPYIIPLGLGEESYPKDWLTEKNGENISCAKKSFGCQIQRKYQGFQRKQKAEYLIQQRKI